MLSGLIPYSLMIFLFLGVAIAIGVKYRVPSKLLMIYGLMLLYFSTTAYLRQLASRHRPENKDRITIFPGYSRPVRFVMFLITPVVCGITVGVLSLVKASKTITLVAFFAVLLTGHLMSLYLSFKENQWRGDASKSNRQ